MQFQFQNLEKRPILPHSNSLITTDPILIKFYQTSYQILIKDYMSKRIENFGEKRVRFWDSEAMDEPGKWGDDSGQKNGAEYGDESPLV